MKSILSFLLVFFAGIAGAIWAQAFLIPFLATSPSFQNVQFLKDWSQRQLVVNPVTEVIVNKAKGIELAVEQAKPYVVHIQNARLQTGQGIIVTADGLIVTQASLIPSASKLTVYLGETKESVFTPRVIKIDAVSDLALLKIDMNGLQPAPFAQPQEVKIGTSVIGVRKGLGMKQIYTLAYEGIMHSFAGEVIETTVHDADPFTSLPLFTLEGKAVGLASRNRQGNAFIVPLPVLRSFLGL